MADCITKQDWMVTEYDETEKIIDTWIIEDRTEHEAEREAESTVSRDCADWTMMPLNKEEENN